MKTKYWVSLLAAPAMMLALGLPAYAKKTAEPVTCTDGTTSTAKGKGACSGHGGVKKADATASTTATTAEKKTKKSKEPKAAETAASPAAAATGSKCKDGSTSDKTGKGTCSGHGGVMKGDAMAPAGAMAPAAAPASAMAPAASKAAPTEKASASDPAGATAKCKDGTYSHAKTHEGSCSHHGGVADWLTPAK
jgi:Protein of unknown function (DUF3761)